MLALLGASVLLALGLAEVSLRLFPGLMPEEVQLQLHWREMSRPVPLSDPYLGYVYPPNHVDRIERPHSDFAFTFTTDEHGFRNPSPWPERADIVVLGDSMAFGYGVDDDKTWTTRLAARLPKNRVINLGVPGFAPQQYLRSYERFGEALRPALVLFCLFPGNDVSDAQGFDRWLKAGAHGNYLEWSAEDASRGRFRRVLEEGYLVTLLHHARQKALVIESGETITFQDGGRLQLAPGLYAKDEFEMTPDHPNFRLVLDTVKQARALAERNGSQFLVLLMPTKEEVCLPLLGEPAGRALASFLTAFDAAEIPTSTSRHISRPAPAKARACTSKWMAIPTQPATA